MVVIKRLSTIAEEKAMQGDIKKMPRTCKLEKFRKA